MQTQTTHRVSIARTNFVFKSSRSRSGRRGRSSSSGQAIVEFLVAGAFVLVPMYLAISAIGKFADVQHTTDSAARYATWERTVWYEGSTSKFETDNPANTKSAAEIGNETAARVLNDRSSTTTVIKSSDKSAAGFVNGIDPMWRDPAGVQYLTDYSQLASTVSKVAEAKGTAVVISSAPYASEKLDLPSSTLATSSIAFKTVSKDSESYQRLWNSPTWEGLELAAKGAILSNTWAANGKAGALATVSGLVATRNPANVLAMGPTLNGAKLALLPWDPIAASGIDVGKVAIDEVPPDRLK